MRRISMPNGFTAVLLAVMFMMFGVFGCGGGGGGDAAGGGVGTSGDGDGDVVVSLTDAPGDFVTYTVDVLSLTLTRADGTEVSTLPLETRIDFTQYAEMTEFLTSATVPSGIYVAATLTLDYTNAEIWVEDDNNGSVEVAAENIRDENGVPIATMALNVHLEGRNRLPIARGIPAHLLLDFDLNTTHHVDMANPQSPVVTVDPILVADVNRQPLKLHRVRGALNEVRSEWNRFSLFLRPFYCPLLRGHPHFGSRPVTTTSTTVYEIDGTQYIGDEGLAAMEALTPLTAVVAIGDLRFHPLRFEARQVYTGTSVPGGGMDVVRGNVISRQGDTMTVKGATLIRSEGSVVFNDEVILNVSDDTIVTRQLSAEPIGTYGKDDISIGQRVVAFGNLTMEGDTLVLDATADDNHVRMALTTLRGTALSIDQDTDTLAMDLQGIDHRIVSLFDFTGTNSDPDNYLVDTGNLDLSVVADASPLRVRGFVEPFGAAPPDFAAQTIVGVADLRAFMKVTWDPASTSAFEEVSEQGLTLNLAEAGPFHHLFRGKVATDLSGLDQATLVAPPSDGQGIFVLRYADGSRQFFLEFESFAQALSDDLNDGLAVRWCHAVGDFDDADTVLTAYTIGVRMVAPE